MIPMASAHRNSAPVGDPTWGRPGIASENVLTALAGAEPVAGAQHPAAQRLQFFMSESRWHPERVNARRLELVLADPATAPRDLTHISRDPIAATIYVVYEGT